MEQTVKQTINQQEADRLRAWIVELKEQEKARAEQIKNKIEREKELQPYFDEYMHLEDEISDLRKEQRNQIRLLKTLIEFAEKASGEKFVYDGPLFNN